MLSTNIRITDVNASNFLKFDVEIHSIGLSQNLRSRNDIFRSLWGMSLVTSCESDFTMNIDFVKVYTYQKPEHSRTIRTSGKLSSVNL